MTSHTDKAKDVAEKVTQRAEDALRELDQVMTFGRWAPEFRAIMWGAVADIALKRKFEAERAVSSGQGTE